MCMATDEPSTHESQAEAVAIMSAARLMSVEQLRMIAEGYFSAQLALDKVMGQDWPRAGGSLADDILRAFRERETK